MTKEGEKTTVKATKESTNSEAGKEEMDTSKKESGETKDSTTTEADKDEPPTDNNQGATTDAAATAEEPKESPSNGDTETKLVKNSDEKCSPGKKTGSDENEQTKKDGNATTIKSAVSNGSDTASTNTPSKTAAATPSSEKVKVHFVAVGAAPIMKKTKFQIGADQRFAAVTTFLRKMLKMSGSGSSLFLYCNSAFVPSPDERVGDLSDCFSIRGELVIHYSLQEAWG